MSSSKDAVNVAGCPIVEVVSGRFYRERALTDFQNTACQKVCLESAFVTHVTLEILNG